ncbi:hypothetical protein ADK90_03065 [Streptomyces sp. XY413]|uniref:hypothetical protein n=1 Tax=Streptomyces sp. XY413 TaxID=1519479 RepID=UPI0006B01D07|nr:hypothetical protein [Streptomyces sp. XY413]KOV26995.1 hypothetical protein ADK90_03065 [Streptomyces sp. XY413]
MPHDNDTGTHRTRSNPGHRSTRSTRSTRGTRSAHRRRALRREVPGTVGLLADAGDFAAMCGYRTFGFDRPSDYADYLHHVDGLLRSFAARGIHTTVALFDPDEYAEYCGEHGLDPDTSETRTRFTAELAGSGTLLPYTGQPIDELVPLLVDEAVRHATWEYATAVLAGVGRCADCGEDIGHASFDRAADALKRLVAGAGPGHHHFVCSVPTEDEQLVAVLHADTTGDPDTPPRIEGRESLDFVTVLAAGLALGGPGGLVVRSTTEGHRDRVHGWRLDRGRLTALSAAAVFNVYCTDADTGDLVAPEPGVEYCPGYEVDAPGPHH